MMRNCPVCDGSKRADLGPYADEFSMYECMHCGMHYLDGDGPLSSQEALNDYYFEDRSPDCQSDDSTERLKRLARAVGPLPTLLLYGWAVDIGGYYSQLQKMIPGMETLKGGQQLTGDYDLVIISHTLEHVYDVRGMMEMIRAHVHRGSRLLIEVPVWLDYGWEKYDRYWQHLNKFRPQDLAHLVLGWGFSVVKSEQIEDFREWTCWRIEGRYEVQ